VSSNVSALLAGENRLPLELTCELESLAERAQKGPRQRIVRRRAIATFAVARSHAKVAGLSSHSIKAKLPQLRMHALFFNCSRPSGACRALSKTIRPYPGAKTFSCRDLIVPFPGLFIRAHAENPIATVGSRTTGFVSHGYGETR